MHPSGEFAAALICGSAPSLARGVVERQAAQQNGLERYGDGVITLRADTEVRLGYVAEAVAVDRPLLFDEQVAWIKVLCAARGVPLELVRGNLEAMRDELLDRLPEDVGPRAAAVVESGLARFETAPVELPSYLAEDAPHVELARRFLLAVLEGRGVAAAGLVTGALERGVDAGELAELVLRKVQYEIGRMWQMNEITVAEEHACSDVVATVTALLRTRSLPSAPNGRRVVAAAVASETHDLGIRNVTLEFERSGWSVVCLGAGSPGRVVVDAVRDFGGDLIALSASSVLYVRQSAASIAMIREDPACKGVPILVGGHPFNLVPDLWRVVGADGCAANAADALGLATRLVGKR